MQSNVNMIYSKCIFIAILYMHFEGCTVAYMPTTGRLIESNLRLIILKEVDFSNTNANI